MLRCVIQEQFRPYQAIMDKKSLNKVPSLPKREDKVDENSMRADFRPPSELFLF
jgi:hypothetical protein